MRFQMSLSGCVSAMIAMLVFAGCVPPSERGRVPAATANVRDLTRITHDSLPEFEPVPHPTEDRILLHVRDDTKRGTERWSIVEVSANSAGRRLLAGPYALAPTWLPDGSGYIYVYQKSGSVLVRSPAMGAGMTFISPKALGDWDFHPNASPDGKQIIFETKFRRVNHICRVNMDGSNFTLFTEGGRPRWHPIEPLVVFHKMVGRHMQVFLLDIKNGQVTQVSSGDFNNKEPSWMGPDRIVFVSDRDTNDHLYLMDRDGGAVTQLTAGNTDEGNPAAGPDGTVFFWSNAGSPRGSRKLAYTDIWRLRVVPAE